MSYSWVDPHFAALYARREEERLAERLVTRMRERGASEPCLEDVRRPEDYHSVPDVVGRGGPLRLL